jgi:hypothetical protein
VIKVSPRVHGKETPMECTAGASRRTAAAWLAMVEAQEKSGLSMARFCREQDIPYHQFLYRKRIKTAPGCRPAGEHRGLVPVESLGGFVRVRVEERSGMRLRFSAGLIVEIDRVPPAAWVAEVARCYAESEVA